MRHYLTRREFSKAAGVGVLGAALPGSLGNETPPKWDAGEMLVYVGTYTNKKSEGIYIYRMNSSSGELRRSGVVKGVTNPSFLAIDRRRRYLYAVNEVGEFGGRSSGAVSAFAIDQKSGDLRLLNQQPSMGAGPCYLVVDPTGKFVLIANYGGGSLCVLPINNDGSLGEATNVVQHQGSGANARRQSGPHAHCVVLDPAGRYAFAADLGLDKVMSYRFDAQKGKLAPNKEPWLSVKPGAGPRHFTFHPSGRYAYLINELDSTLTALAYNQRRGTLQHMQTVSTLPPDFTGENFCADVHVHPSGRFVYGSNRGHDSIAAFAINKATGRLTYIAHAATQGKTPRNFAIDPTGTFLLAANQNSDKAVTFRIDAAAGRLKETGYAAEIPTPVCLKLIPAFS